MARSDNNSGIIGSVGGEAVKQPLSLGNKAPRLPSVPSIVRSPASMNHHGHTAALDGFFHASVVEWH